MFSCCCCLVYIYIYMICLQWPKNTRFELAIAGGVRVKMLTIRPLSYIRDGAAVKCHIISPSFHTSHSDSFSSLILSVVVLTSKRVRVIHTTGTQDLRVPWNPHTKIHLNMLSGSSRKLLPSFVDTDRQTEISPFIKHKYVVVWL